MNVSRALTPGSWTLRGLWADYYTTRKVRREAKKFWQQVSVQKLNSSALTNETLGLMRDSIPNTLHENLWSEAWDNHGTMISYFIPEFGPGPNEYFSAIHEMYLKRPIQHWLEDWSCLPNNNKFQLHENYEEQDANSIGDRRKRSAELGSEQNDVPTFESEMSQFRHGYIPMTGTGNREEMKIDPLTPLKLLVNPKPKSTPGSWKYKRFNSSDFVMLHSTHEVHIWRKTFTEEDEIFHFDLKRTLCSVGDTNEGEVLHSLFYTQRENFIETLHFAYVLNLPSGGYELRDYDISMEDCVHSRITKLDNRHPKSLKYVETDNLKSFVILYIDVHENPQIKCIDCRKRFETKLIEISVAYVTDLETFTINGDAFAAVAHKNGVDVYIIEEKVENSRWIDGRSILGVTDLISFRIGFKYFLGIATEMGPQHLLLWNDEKFIDEQLFDIKGVKQWDAIHIETCREDVILVFYSIGHEAPISLFIWNGNTHRFNLAIDDLRRTSPLKLDVRPFTQTFFVHNAVVNILYLDSNSDTRVIPLQTRLVPLADPVSVSVNYITKILTKIGERFKQQDLFVEKFKNLLKDAVRPDKDVHVLFPQVFNKIEVLRRTTLRDIKHVTNVIWKNSQLTLNDLSYTIGDLRKRLGHLKNEIGKIRSEMDDVVFRNVPSKIFGKVTFRGSVDIASINASNLIINEIANEPLSPILNNVYQIGRTNISANEKYKWIKFTQRCGSKTSRKQNQRESST
ncbi:hypothetical protein B4U80_13036 [Leptotrombidium deliense]|uniref:Uncharacterized protein n=1 Tax=Leptotrombidium deliense TaxID=299467 RepID=A0A443SE87_9ACAR|nr:hypothetical protein B4U80_13036 [Leptotrombidium deliense]